VKLINLTPHEVTLYDPEGREILARIPSSGEARVKVEQELVGWVFLGDLKFPVYASMFGEVTGLPDPEPGTETVFIVSFPVLQAMAGKRRDLVSPDTTPNGVVRSPNGKVLGVKSFQTLWPY